MINKELTGSINYFLNEVNLNDGPTYGLVRDITNSNVCSVASNGFAFLSYPIAIEHNLLTYDEAYKRIDKTLDTYLNLEQVNGFYYHFIDMNTGTRLWDCELSILDTTLLVLGALVASEYFDDNIKVKANKLYERVNYKWFSDDDYFYMGYKDKFFGKLDWYAEHLMTYVLAVNHPNYPVDKSLYDNFLKVTKDGVIYTYCGGLFTYQYSHAFIDFRDKKDESGIDWYQNSINATLKNREYCIKNNKFKSYNEKSWGLSPCLGPNGYSGEYGASPASSEIDKYNDGTIALSAAISSINFTPTESLASLEYFYNIPELIGKYGLKNSYNIIEDKIWTSEEYIGIDKGITMLMLENYLSGLVWDLSNKNEIIQNGLKELNIKKYNKINIVKKTNI